MYTIITHPLIRNYGGILQSYALQHILNTIGCRNQIFDYIPKDLKATLNNYSILSKIKQIIKLCLITTLRYPTSFPIIFYPKFFFNFKRQFLQYFNSKSNSQQIRFLKNNYFILGSDQVWRCIYARSIESVPFFFLNFATKEQRNNSIAYAASFGSDEWEGTEEETAECAKLIKDFKAISVREHSGVRICKEVFGVDAVQMPDPTLLLNQEDYNYLIKNWRTKKSSNPFMAIYILDENENNKMLAHSLCLESNLYPQHLMPHSGAKKLMDRLPLSVPQWLRFMRDCECVLTDSFHGCAFSIIFNKPFICLGNKSRGSARFDSLLNTFGLQERLVTNPTIGKLLKLINTPINWQKVNEIRKSEQLRALNFLRTNLI